VGKKTPGRSLELQGNHPKERKKDHSEKNNPRGRYHNAKTTSDPTSSSIIEDFSGNQVSPIIEKSSKFE